MARVIATGTNDKGEVFLIVKESGKDLVVRMSTNVAMNLFIDLGVAIDKARGH